MNEKSELDFIKIIEVCKNTAENGRQARNRENSCKIHA